MEQLLKHKLHKYLWKLLLISMLIEMMTQTLKYFAVATIKEITFINLTQILYFF